jgi:type II secretory pathway pseudopilin PulG
MCEKTFKQLFIQALSKKSTVKPQTSNEGGYALLALILALAVLGIVLTSSVAPNYQVASQREKEVELYYRGQQMAEGIARYYMGGAQQVIRINPLQLRFPPAYGYLKELKKLKEGVTINLQERKFVRPSATIDPFDGEEWDPVYARDPRIMPFLQAWAAETGGIIDQDLMLIAGTPIRTQPINPSNGSSGSSPIPPPSGSSAGGGGIGAGNPNPQPGGTAGQGRGQNRTNPNDDDDDDDDDLGSGNDPLGHLFSSGGGSSGGSGLPIVGVAPRRKGPAIRPFYGLRNYEEWVFIYIPPSTRFTVPAPNTNIPPGQRTSQ